MALVTVFYEFLARNVAQFRPTHTKPPSSSTTVQRLKHNTDTEEEVLRPRTNTRIGVDGCPAPRGEYGVHEYWPSSAEMTGLKINVPCLLTLAWRTCWKSIKRPDLDHTITVNGGFDSTGQSMRPIRPRGRYSRSGTDSTRGTSVHVEKATATSSGNFKIGIWVTGLICCI